MERENYDIEDFILDESFQRYVFGLNQNDEIFWENWIAQNNSRLNEIEEAKFFLSNLQFESESITNEELKIEISRMKTAINSPTKERYLKSTYFNTYFFNRKIAAVITLIFFTAMIFYFINENNVTNQERKGIYAADFVVKSVPLGQKNELTLTDGTRIKLNAGSTLKIYPDFNAKERKVILEGEAFFDVAENQISKY